MDYLPHLQILWDYLCLHRKPEKADVILGFGCYDENVARRAARLYLDGFAPKVLFTGGLGRNTCGRFARSEAERFARVALDMGVPEKDILLESKASNTRQNIEFSRALLEERNIPHGRILGVHKPYMERRITAAMGIYWPEQRFCVTSFPQTLQEALDAASRQGLTEREIIDTVVGDFQRIDVYARLGWQLPQYIPRKAWKAYEALVAMGYDKQLIK